MNTFYDDDTDVIEIAETLSEKLLDARFSRGGLNADWIETVWFVTDSVVIFQENRGEADYSVITHYVDSEENRHDDTVFTGSVVHCLERLKYVLGRYVILNGYTCEPMSGGYWSVSFNGELIAAWVTKERVREITK